MILRSARIFPENPAQVDWTPVQVKTVKGSSSAQVDRAHFLTLSE